MNIITSITAQPRQNFIIKLDNNEYINFYLYFYSNTKSWYFDFEYNDYVSRGNKVVLSFNTIRNVRNIVPFGFGFLSISNAEPFMLESFVNADVTMVIWNQEEVQMLEDTLYNAE